MIKMGPTPWLWYLHVHCLWKPPKKQFLRNLPKNRSKFPATTSISAWWRNLSFPRSWEFERHAGLVLKQKGRISDKWCMAVTVALSQTVFARNSLVPPPITAMTRSGISLYLVPSRITGDSLVPPAGITRMTKGLPGTWYDHESRVPITQKGKFKQNGWTLKIRQLGVSEVWNTFKTNF